MLLAILVMFILDVLWITLNKTKYNKLVYDVQHKKMNVNIISAIIAYILMIIGIIYITVPLAKTKKNKLIGALKYGGLFGLCVYGIYNATNYAIFQDYNLITGIIDTIWGMTLFSIITYIAIKF